MLVNWLCAASTKHKTVAGTFLKIKRPLTPWGGGYPPGSHLWGQRRRWGQALRGHAASSVGCCPIPPPPSPWSRWREQRNNVETGTWLTKGLTRCKPPGHQIVQLMRRSRKKTIPVISARTQTPHLLMLFLQINIRHEQVETRIVNELPSGAFIAVINLFEVNQYQQETDVLLQSGIMKWSNVRRHSYRRALLGRTNKSRPDDITLRFSQSLHEHEHHWRVTHHGFIGRHGRSLSGESVHDLTDWKWHSFVFRIKEEEVVQSGGQHRQHHCVVFFPLNVSIFPGYHTEILG